MLNSTIFETQTILWVAVLSVALVGLSKGGLGGAFSMMGVPLLSLVMPPVLAAAVLLPILIMMDAVSLYFWRGWRDWPTLKIMLPAAMIGIGAGWMTAAIMPEAVVRLIVGVVALSFGIRMIAGQVRGRSARHIPMMGWFWGAISGFTSFVAHTGGPPFQVHVLPRRMDPKLYTGTSVTFFAIVNAVKVLPYALLGMFDTPVLISAAMMLPIAVISVGIGAAIVRRMSPEVFYPFTYTMILLVGIKLVWDGIAAL